jgi:hypothetical protein
MVNITDLGHQIVTNTTNIPSTNSGKLDHLTKEATENNVHPNMNRVDGFALSIPWLPHIQSLKERWQQAFLKNRTVLTAKGNTTGLHSKSHMNSVSMATSQRLQIFTFPTGWDPQKGSL